MIVPAGSKRFTSYFKWWLIVYSAGGAEDWVSEGSEKSELVFTFIKIIINLTINLSTTYWPTANICQRTLYVQSSSWESLLSSKKESHPTSDYTVSINDSKDKHYKV